mgnify:CR=1 FL=1
MDIFVQKLHTQNKNQTSKENNTFVTLLKILFGVGIGTRKYGVVDTFSNQSNIYQVRQ